MTKWLYYIRVIFIFLQALFIVDMINIIMNMNGWGISFIIVTIIFFIKTLMENINNYKSYKYDIPYNIMQIGYTIYLGVFLYRIKSNTILPLYGYEYLKNNLIILDILLIFIFIYSLLIGKEFYNEK